MCTDVLLVHVAVGPGDDEDLVEEGSNTELAQLLAQESGGQVTGGREPFDDHYGDAHDWSSGVTTQLYLCRQLYLHYTFNVSHSLVLHPSTQ